MSVKPTPLGTQIASLRKAGAAPSGADRGRLSTALHTLIAAIFARIFDRLEQILLLWQAGQLPKPVVRQRPQAKTEHHKTTKQYRGIAPRRRAKSVARPLRAKCVTNHVRTPIDTRTNPASVAPPCRPRPRSRAARGPPCGRVPTLSSGMHNRGNIVSISLS